jgi:hypothetical protein
MNKRRLYTLIHFMEKLPRKYARRFDMNSWSDSDPPDGDLTAPGCATTACAMGWATAVPSFKKLGLRLEHGLPHIGGITGGYTAARKLFDLNDEEANHLFDSLDEANHLFDSPDEADHLFDSPAASDLTPKQWAKKARAFIKSGGVPQATTVSTRTSADVALV